MENILLGLMVFSLVAIMVTNFVMLTIFVKTRNIVVVIDRKLTYFYEMLGGSVPESWQAISHSDSIEELEDDEDLFGGP